MTGDVLCRRNVLRAVQVINEDYWDGTRSINYKMRMKLQSEN